MQLLAMIRLGQLFGLLQNSNDICYCHTMLQAGACKLRFLCSGRTQAARAVCQCDRSWLGEYFELKHFMCKNKTVETNMKREILKSE